MSNHETYREWLTLAAAGALEKREEHELQTHAASCAECAAAWADLQAMAGALRRMPTPQPAAEVVQRSIARATWELAEAADRRQRRNALVLVMVTAWLATMGTSFALQAACARMGMTVGLTGTMVVMTALTWSVAAMFCASQAKEQLLRRQE